jgi:hypothetical protein
MPLSSSVVEKPLQVMLIDQFFSGSPDELRQAYELARSLLEHDDYGLDNITQRLVAGGPGPLRLLTSDDANHFRTHWLGVDRDDDTYGWADESVGRIMRAAYLDAVNAASGRDVPIPIETFWVFSPLGSFEMKVSEGRNQITVFALIPGKKVEFGTPPPGISIRHYGRDNS